MSKSKASEHLADGEIDQLYANGVLGCGDSEVLQSTIFFPCMCIYGYENFCSRFTRMEEDKSFCEKTKII